MHSSQLRDIYIFMCNFYVCVVLLKFRFNINPSLSFIVQCGVVVCFNFAAYK